LKKEQLSFLESIENSIKNNEVYDATICYKCLCAKCKYNTEIYPFLTPEECKEKETAYSCLNCDECYYYGMDNESLSRNKIKFKCDKFQMSNYYKELEVKRRRKGFKIIKS